MRKTRNKPEVIQPQCLRWHITEDGCVYAYLSIAAIVGITFMIVNSANQACSSYTDRHCDYSDFVSPIMGGLFVGLLWPIACPIMGLAAILCHFFR